MSDPNRWVDHCSIALPHDDIYTRSGLGLSEVQGNVRLATCLLAQFPHVENPMGTPREKAAIVTEGEV